MRMKLAPLFALNALMSLSSGCGLMGKKDAADPTNQAIETAGSVDPITGKSGKKTADGKPILEQGDVATQRFSLAAGDASWKLQVRKLQTALHLAGVDESALEISLLDAEGKELKFLRGAADDIEEALAPGKAGDYVLTVKTNDAAPLVIEDAQIDGAAAVQGILPAAEDPAAIHKDIALKAIVAFARECKQFTADGNVQTTKAPSGEAFLQPLVFLGQVKNGKAERLAKADISIVADGKSYALKALPDMNYDTFREMGGMTQAQHVDYTRDFYQGYLGGVGEFYTTDTFQFGGDCALAPRVKLAADIGLTEVKLVVEDASVSPALDEEIVIRASSNPSFSIWESSGQKLQDYTQCTWNRVTGEPKTYNGDASVCKEFSLADLPYVGLDYKMPSEQSGGVLSKESDPTRIMLYGHSLSKSWYNALLANAEALASDAKKELAIEGCRVAGGSTNVPLSPEKTLLPLGELNARKGDVISLGYKAGRYTGLVKFFQGNVDTAADLVIPTCIPLAGKECDVYKTIKVSIGGCNRKADSGVFAAALSDSFIYPGYFSMSGIIKD